MTDRTALHAPREFVYRRQAHAGHRPGAHRSRSGSLGFEFRAHLPLHAARDARRLDVGASLRDPLGGWWVRASSERLAIPLVLLMDVSASMAYVGEVNRQQALAELLASAAWSAHRMGDSFQVIAYASTLERAWCVPASHQVGLGLALARRLAAADLRAAAPAPAPVRAHAGALAATHPLPRRRAVVIWASDFLCELPSTQQALAAMAAHDVLPVVLADRSEAEPPAGRGLAWLQDAEMPQRQQLLVLSDRLRTRWRTLAKAREAQLNGLFARAQRRPLWCWQGFDADALTRHLAR